MLGWIRGGIVGAILAVSFVACGGDDFSSESPGTGDASTGGAGGSAGSPAGGSSGTLPTGGTGNATADAALEGPADHCGDSMTGTTCTDLSTGVGACDSCGQASCCDEIQVCLADANCSRAMRCYLDQCFDQPAVACMYVNCQSCVALAFTSFTAMSSCLLGACGGSSGQCPQFKN